MSANEIAVPFSAACSQKSHYAEAETVAVNINNGSKDPSGTFKRSLLIR